METWIIWAPQSATYFYTQRCITFSWSWQNPRCWRTQRVFWNVIHQGAKPNYLTNFFPQISFNWTWSQNVSHLTLKVIYAQYCSFLLELMNAYAFGSSILTPDIYIKKHLRNAFQAKVKRIICNWSSNQLDDRCFFNIFVLIEELRLAPCYKQETLNLFAKLRIWDTSHSYWK